MPENNNSAADVDKDAGEGQGGTDDQNNSNATGEGEGAETGKGTDGDGGDDTDKGADDDQGNGQDDDSDGEGKGKAKAPKTQDKDDDADDGEEPPERKRLSTQDFIIGRKHKKLTKAKAKDDADNADDDEKSGDDDEIAPEDEEMITKVVAKTFAPIIDKSLAAEDERELQDFLKDNPDFKPFEAKARRYMQHPSRRSLPVKSIFYEVAGDKLLKIGAERSKQADKKAKDTQTGGGSNRGGEGDQNVWDLTPEQFAEKQEKIRRGQA